jgi:hypothetical protein
VRGSSAQGRHDRDEKVVEDMGNRERIEVEEEEEENGEGWVVYNK